MKAKDLNAVEVSVVFLAIVWLFWWVNATPVAAQIAGPLGGRPFLGYAVLLVVAFGLYLFRVLRPPQGLTAPKLKYQLDITAIGFLPFFVLSALLSWIDWRQWPGAALVAGVTGVLIFWFARWAAKKPAWQGALPGGWLLLLPAVPAASKLAGVAVDLVFFYVLVAFGEEILFRGYIQSRLNSVFGRPWSLFGIRWGWGLVVAAVLFGLWHLGWQPGGPQWPHALWTAFAGLLLGLVREKSESVVAPALLHGVMNYGPQAILFVLLWS